jgi:hypothetical protein
MQTAGENSQFPAITAVTIAAVRESALSAFGGKADIAQTFENVRF